MKTFLPFLLLLSSNIYLAHSSQNLCDDARDAGLIFANDPSECDRYLFCERDENDEVSVVYQMICDDPAYPNFLGDGCFPATVADGGFECTDGTGTATPPENPDYVLELCPTHPDLQESGLRFADPADSACQKSQFCSTLVTFDQTCTGTLLFDRNFGRCALPENAPCGPVNAPVRPSCECDDVIIPVADCATAINIPYPNNCYKYVTCKDGEILTENECGGGLQFNPKTGLCDRTTNISPPCPYTRFTEAKIASIPRAQPKTRNVNPLIPQLRRIIMAKRQ